MQIEPLEFGAYASKRILATLKSYGLPSTWFIPGFTIESWPRECERVVAAGALREGVRARARLELYRRLFSGLRLAQRVVRRDVRETAPGTRHLRC